MKSDNEYGVSFMGDENILKPGNSDACIPHECLKNQCVIQFRGE